MCTIEVPEAVTVSDKWKQKEKCSWLFHCRLWPFTAKKGNYNWNSFDLLTAISLKRCKIGPRLLWRINRKSHTRFFDWYQNQWPWMTLSGWNEFLQGTVVRHQNSGAVEDFILPYSAVYLRIQKWKNYWNRSTFAKVIVKIKVAPFYGPRCTASTTRLPLAQSNQSCIMSNRWIYKYRVQRMWLK